jgi:hypothetical protein
MKKKPEKKPVVAVTTQWDARQRAEQLARANDDLWRRQQANADAWVRQEPLPFPEAGFPGYINPYGR